MFKSLNVICKQPFFLITHVVLWVILTAQSRSSTMTLGYFTRRVNTHVGECVTLYALRQSPYSDLKCEGNFGWLMLCSCMIDAGVRRSGFRILFRLLTTLTLAVVADSSSLHRLVTRTGPALLSSTTTSLTTATYWTHFAKLLHFIRLIDRQRW